MFARGQGSRCPQLLVSVMAMEDVQIVVLLPIFDCIAIMLCYVRLSTLVTSANVALG